MLHICSKHTYTYVLENEQNEMEGLFSVSIPD